GVARLCAGSRPARQRFFGEARKADDGDAIAHPEEDLTRSSFLWFRFGYREPGLRRPARSRGFLDELGEIRGDALVTPAAFSQLARRVGLVLAQSPLQSVDRGRPFSDPDTRKRLDTIAQSRDFRFDLAL